MNKINNPIFVVTVDTESDDAWSNPETIKLDNIKEIPRFQELCEKYDIIPTYLVSYECASNEESVSILKPILDKNKCEIGHHLHVWSTPPFQKVNDSKNVDLEWIHAYQFELPNSLFEEKFESLFEMIYTNFGVYPSSHRAGRWGIDERTIEFLIKKKFKVDTSVVPLVSYINQKGKNISGPNFINKPTFPFYWHRLLEIPVTVNNPFNSVNLNFISNFSPKKKWLVNKLEVGKMLRPNPSYPVIFYKKLIGKEIRLKKPIINLMLHSSELGKNCSPFSNNAENLRKMWFLLDEIFKTVKFYGLKSFSLTYSSEIIRNSIL